jgi:hypothetical protein
MRIQLFILMILFVCVYSQDVTDCNTDQKAAVLTFCSTNKGSSCWKNPDNKNTVGCIKMNEGGRKCRGNEFYACRDFMKTNPFIQRFQCDGGWDIVCLQYR